VNVTFVPVLRAGDDGVDDIIHPGKIVDVPNRKLPLSGVSISIKSVMPVIMVSSMASPCVVIGHSYSSAIMVKYVVIYICRC